VYCSEQRIAVMLLQRTDGLVCQAAQTGWVSSCYYTGFHGVCVSQCLERPDTTARRLKTTPTACRDLAINELRLLS